MTLKKKKITRVSIVAGGSLEESLLPRIKEADYVIGVDRGAWWLIEHGVIPNVAVGDFDSVIKKERLLIQKKARKVIEYPSQKDATDLELTVDYAIAQHPQSVTIYGGLGKRFDHTIASVYLLEKFMAKGIPAKIMDSHNEIFLIDKSIELLRSKTHQYVSLHSITATTKVTLEGFRYSVRRKTFTRGSTLGVSNEIVGKRAVVEVHKGTVLIIRSRD